MKKPEYCTAPDRLGDCLGCSLSSYHRDCTNKPIPYQKTRLTLWLDGPTILALKSDAAAVGMSVSEFVGKAFQRSKQIEAESVYEAAEERVRKAKRVAEEIALCEPWAPK